MCCCSYCSEKQRLEDKVDVLEGEYQKLQKTINRSKKAKDIELLLNENKNLQKKLEDQEDEFRLQNKTLLEELATVSWFIICNVKDWKFSSLQSLNCG